MHLSKAMKLTPKPAIDLKAAMCFLIWACPEKTSIGIVLSALHRIIKNWSQLVVDTLLNLSGLEIMQAWA